MMSTDYLMKRYYGHSGFYSGTS